MLAAIMYAKAAIYILAAHNIRQLSVAFIALSTSGGSVNTEQFTSRYDELRHNEQQSLFEKAKRVNLRTEDQNREDARALVEGTNPEFIQLIKIMYALRGGYMITLDRVTNPLERWQYLTKVLVMYMFRRVIMQINEQLQRLEEQIGKQQS
jgi:hypothetical protein